MEQNLYVMWRTIKIEFLQIKYSLSEMKNAHEEEIEENE